VITEETEAAKGKVTEIMDIFQIYKKEVNHVLSMVTVDSREEKKTDLNDSKENN